MQTRIFARTLFFLAAFSVGAFLGRRWTGSLADTVLALVALTAVVFVSIAAVGYLRGRVASLLFPHPPLPAPKELAQGRVEETVGVRGEVALGKHLFIARRQDRWVLRLQDWWRIESLELTFALPRGRVIESRKPMSATRRITYFVSGLALVLAAQYLIFQIEPRFIRFPFTEWLNNLLRIDIANLDNVILAIVLLTVGGYFLVRAISAVVFSDPDLSDRSFAPAELVANLQGRIGALAVVATLLFVFLLWRLSDRDISGWLPILWIAPLVLLGIVFYFFDHRANVLLSPSLQWRDVILIALLFSLGLVVGTYRLTQIPNSFMGDEGTFWETAKGIANWEYRPPIFDFGVYSYPILGSFYQALILKIFGLSLWSWRFASVLIAVAATVPTYLLAREMFDRRVAVLASAVMVVTPYFIAVERLGYNNAQALLPVALSLYLLYAGLRRGSTLYLYLGGISAGFGFYSYTAGRLALIVAALYFAYLFAARFVQRAGKTKEPFQNALVSLGVLGAVFAIGWAVTALPHLTFGNAVNSELLRTKTLESVFANDIYANDFLPGEDLYRDVPPLQIGPYTLFYRTDLIVRLAVRGFVRSFLVFQHAKLVTEHFIAGPLAGPAATVFYFLGLVITLASLRKRTFILLAFWFLGGVFLLSVISTFPPRAMHLVSIIPAMSLLIAVGIVAVADFIAARIARWQRAMAYSIALGCFGVIGLTDLDNYLVTVPQTYLPIAEHVMGFAQIELTSPRQMIYVYSNPAERDFRPWEVKTIPNLGEFHTVAREDLENNRFGIEPGKAYTFFFKDQNSDATVNYLTRMLGKEIAPKSYLNREGQVILLSYAFGD